MVSQKLGYHYRAMCLVSYKFEIQLPSFLDALTNNLHIPLCACERGSGSGSRGGSGKRRKGGGVRIMSLLLMSATHLPSVHLKL